MVYSCFIDTNVWLELYLKRKRHQEVEALVALIDRGDLKAYVSESVLTTIVYILESSGVAKRENVKELISKMLLKVDVLPIDKVAVHNALNSGIKDIEDAILYFVAFASPRIDCFVTYNTKDFIYSDPKLPVYEPAQVTG